MQRLSGVRATIRTPVDVKVTRPKETEEDNNLFLDKLGVGSEVKQYLSSSKWFQHLLTSKGYSNPSLVSTLLYHIKDMTIDQIKSIEKEDPRELIWNLPMTYTYRVEEVREAETILNRTGKLKSSMVCGNPKCRSTEVFFYFIQKARADEPTTVKYHCYGCGNRW